MATSLVRYIVKQLDQLGVDEALLAERCRLRPWRDCGPFVPRTVLTDVWVKAVEVAGPGLGVRMAERSRRRHWASMGSLASSSATVGDALMQMSRATRLISDSLRISFHVEGDRCSWVLDLVSPDRLHPEHVEYLVASAMLSCRRFSRTEVDPIEVYFRHKAPASTAHQERLFRAPVRYGASRNGFDLDSAVMRRPLATHDEARQAQLADQVDRLLAEQPDPSDLRRRVRDAIAAELPDGDVSSERVAPRLGMHPKTLSRKLRDIGTSYREILEDLRYGLASRYLSRPDLTLEDVALLLGYSEKSAFHRAFKRWSGLSPVEFRKKMSSS